MVYVCDSYLLAAVWWFVASDLVLQISVLVALLGIHYKEGEGRERRRDQLLKRCTDIQYTK